MAFGLSPKYMQDIPLNDLTPEQFLVIAIETAKFLEWKIGATSDSGFIAYSPYSMRSMSEEITVKIDGQTAHIKSECVGSQLLDYGKNKKNVREFEEKLGDFKTSLSPEVLSDLYNEIKKGFPLEDELGINKTPLTQAKKSINGFFAIFKPTDGYFITPIIIDLNILVFVLMALSGVNILQPDNASIIKWGANFGPQTLNGEWWRLITNCFIHIGIFHLLFNMYALLYIGVLLEQYLGRTRFAASYILTGIAASMTSLFWHSYTISAGASGAIFGLYGVFLAMLTTNVIEKSARRTLLTSIGLFVFYNLANGMKNGIDNAAHIGGLISGMLIGYCYYPSLRSPYDIRLNKMTTVVLAVSIFTASFFVYRIIPNDLPIYDQKMKSFAAMESMALEVFKLPDDTPKNAMLSEIKDRGIYYWNEDISIIQGMEKLNIPDILHNRDKVLLNYCDLRIKSYELLYKAVEEGDNGKYKDEMENYNKQIQTTIDSLKNS